MTAPTVLIGGDFVIDHHVYEGRRRRYGDARNPGVRVVRQIGGAALIRDLLAATRPRKEGDAPGAERILLPEENVHLTVVEKRREDEAPDGHRAHAFWRPRGGGEGREAYWRVGEAMGFGFSVAAPRAAVWPSNPQDLPERADVVVLSDGGMGCRDEEECWRPLAGRLNEAAWIVLKTTDPFGAGRLWQELSGDAALRKKLVVVASAADLRQEDARIGAGLAWEGTLADLLRELAACPALAELAKARHLVVSFGHEGCAWIDTAGESGDPAAWSVLFVGDVSAAEGDAAYRTQGAAFGALSCFAASVVWQLGRVARGASPDRARALAGGLSAARDLLARGHGPAEELAQGFPAARLAEEIRSPSERFAQVEVRGAAIDADWSIIGATRRDESAPALQLGRAVLMRGPIALRNLPHLHVRGLVATDRDEIESIRTIRDQFRYYRDHESGKTPLSIGVFGPPGSGKSFAVSQIAKELVGDESWLEFNLSQFESERELIGAFHQVRDRVLQKQLPVAFFDEFDAKGYRWLQSLLAPMQDGRFQQGQITHTLGKCIFVFAGATSWTYETFGPAEGSVEFAELRGRFVLAKGPDFKSRLDAYLDVCGPNRRWRAFAQGDAGTPEGTLGHAFVPDEADFAFPIRRALMIRAKLGCAEDEPLDVDPGLAHALLAETRFEHGARSLDKILQPLVAARPAPLRRSLLPPARQLRMQVPDAGAFLEHCEGHAGSPAPLPEAEVEKVAAAAHAAYREQGQQEGWIRRELDVPFEELQKSCGERLGRFFQQSNREAARRIPQILDLVGLRLEASSAAWKDEDRSRIRAHLESHLELLAAEEHRGWMDWHVSQGYKHGVETDHEARRHVCLLPYAKLSEAQRDKDRDAIRSFPKHAEVLAKKIVFAEEVGK